MKKLRQIICILSLSTVLSLPALASGPNFNDTTQQALAPNAAGNVGIGSANPGQTLDVNGTVRAISFLGNGSALTGIGAAFNYWKNDTGNVGINTAYNVGIGTISQINSLNILGNIGIGTFSYDPFMINPAPNGGMIISGNVGIGTWVPNYELDVEGGESNFNSSNTTATLNVYNGNNTGSAVYGSAGNINGVGVKGVTTGTGGIGVSGQTNSGGYAIYGSVAVAGGYAGIFTGGNVGIGTITPAGALTVMSGNVGIGTWVPGQILDVIGTVRMTGFNIASGAGLNKVLTSDANGNGTWAVGGAGSNYWLLDSGNVGINTAYNVGIGTISQINKLNILGNIGIGTFSYDPFMINPAPNGGMIISGNVGIGTWVPNANLNINTGLATGAAILSITNSTAGQVYNVGADGAFESGPGFITGINNGSLIILDAGFDQPDLVATNSGEVFAWSNSPTSTATIDVGLSRLSAGNVGVGTGVPGSFSGGLMANNIGIGTNLISTSALTVMNGNVGIGTWAPAVPLEINGGSPVSPSGWNSGGALRVDGNGGMGVNGNIVTNGGQFIYGNNDAQFGGTNSYSTTAGFYYDLNTSGQHEFLNSGSIVLQTQGVATGAILFGTGNSSGGNPTTQMIITGGGNVGIGTNVPVGKLTINGGVGIGTVFSSYVTTIPPSGGLIVQSNVGIGSLTPGQILDVQGTVRMTGFNIASGAGLNKVLTSDANGNGTWAVGGAGSNYWLLDSGNVGINTAYNVGIGTISQINSLNILGNIGIGTFSYDQFMKDAAPSGGMIISGNVGIGTWAPLFPLEVNARAGNNEGIGVLIRDTFDNTNYAVIGFDETGGATDAYSMGVGNGSETTYGVAGKWFLGDKNAVAMRIVVDANGNVGIGTVLSSGGLAVMNGNVGIGTWKPRSALDIEGTLSVATFGGSVGIGTWLPQAALEADSSGTGILGTTSSGSAGVAGVYGSSTNSASAIYGENSQYGTGIYGDSVHGIGIKATSEDTNPALLATAYGTGFSAAFVSGTTATTAPTLVVQQFSTSTADLFEAQNNGNTPLVNITSAGNVGIGTWITQGALDIKTGTNVLVESGNVGIGSLTPGQALDVKGTARMTGFTLTGNGANNGYVIVGNSVGVGTWMAASTLPGSGGSSGWTATGNNVYETAGGNVGIGTTFLTTAALTVMNGNVGIGTWLPNGSLIIQGGNVGIGTSSPSALFTVNGSSIIGFISTSADNITSSGTGSLAGGWAEHGTNNGSIISSGNGSLAYGLSQGAIANSSIISNGGGAIALGYSVAGGILESTNLGAIALGDAQQGTLGATGQGSIALGYAFSANLEATGNGSVAIGENVQATQNNAMALGSSFTNNQASSLMVGFGTTPTMTINTSNIGIGTFGGVNVGIGSLTPGQMLDVQGTVRMTGFAMATGAGLNKVLTSDANGNGTWAAGGAGSNYWLLDSGNVGINTAYNVGIGTISQINTLNILGNIGIGTFSYDPYMKTTAPIGGMIISGNVGIGTWAPSSNLTDNGTFSAGGAGFTVSSVGVVNDQSTYGYELFGQNAVSSENAATTLGIADGGGGSWNSIGFLWSGGSWTEFITSTGNVGIGTVTPVAALGIVGNVGIGTGINSSYLTTTPPSGGMIIQGNVGIGSLAPGQKLDVNGTVRMTGFAMATGAGNLKVLTSDANGNGTWAVGGAGSNYWLLDSGNVGINTAYNVGIGTISQINSLNILGNIGIGTFSYDPFMRNPAPNGGMAVSGNVGIGTWKPRSALDIEGTLSVATFGGNVGIGTWIPSTNLAVNGAALIGIETGGPGSTIVSNGTGTLAVGYSQGGLGNTNITSSGLGSIAMGNAVSVGATGSITASGSGSIAMGNGTGTMTSSNQGSIAMGLASNLNTLQATGTASVALGQDVQALQSNAMALGSSFINNQASSLMVGFSSTPTMTVTGSNVGIGTMGGANVGIGSVTPGQKLDVQGTVRMTAFLMTPGAGLNKVLTSDANGNGTWATGGAGSNYWLNDTAGNVGISTIYAVGIGTTFVGGTGEASFAVMNGNVGIGTWIPQASIDDENSAGAYFAGSVGINTGEYLAFSGTNGSSNISGNGNNAGGDYVQFETHYLARMYINNSGNVGIGSTSPGQALDVQGTVRALYFIGNGSGLTNLSAGGWTQSGANVYETSGGNVGIGTTMLTTSALSIMNGNVGVGTWLPRGTLDVEGTLSVATFGGNVGIGTWVPSGGLVVMKGNVGIGTNSPSETFDSLSTYAESFYVEATGANATIDINTRSLNEQAMLWFDEQNNTTYGIGQQNNTLPSDFILWDQQRTRNTMVIQGINGYLGFMMPNDASAPQVIITPTNVGIGTSAPASRLSVSGGVGIGTTATNGAYVNYNTAPAGGLIVQGDVGIGTFSPFAGGLIVLPANTGNVGIGSLVPGQALDVQGTVRMTGFNIASGAGLNKVLTSDANGNGTWAVGGAGSNYWLLDSGNVGINTVYNVGIGTNAQINSLNILGNIGIGTFSYDPYMKSAAPKGGMIVSGPVGIGTWQPETGFSLEVKNGAFYVGSYQNMYVDPGSSLSSSDETSFVQFGGNYINMTAASATTTGLSLDFNNNVGLGTYEPRAGLSIMGGNVGIGTWNVESGSLIIANALGNVGIGSIRPGQKLDVNGTVRMTGFNIASGAGLNKVLTSDANGNGTWAVGGAGSNYWLLDSGNVGINTAYNVGIGTIAQTNSLNIIGNIGIGTETYSNYLTKPAPNGGMAIEGNVGIGTWIPGAALEVEGGNVGIGTNSPGSALQVIGGFSFGLPSSATGGVGSISASITNIAGGYASGQSGVNGSIISSGGGSIAIGEALSAGVGNTSIISSSGGSIAMGSASFGGTIKSSGNGSIAMGLATISGTSTLQATQQGSVAIGDTVQATATDAEAFGLNVVNNIADTYMVGFNATPTLTVTGTNVGIGTFNPFGGGLIVTNGNVGISSLTPGQKLDVTGTIRTTNFTLTGQAPISGYVLTASDSAGDATWSSPGGVSGWTVTGNNVYEAAGGNVGIGTNLVTTAALTVMNGNVGIGTWIPGQALQVNNTFAFNSEYNNGNSGAALTVNWNNGNKQKVTLNNNCVFSFTAPNAGVNNLLLRLIQDGTGSRTAAWPGAVHWPSATAPTLTTTPSQVDVVTCYWNGSNYDCTSTLNFAP